MLKIKSFKIGDSEGMNELLSKNLLAKEATILVSNGEVAIPFEDGESMNKDQRIVSLKELKNEEYEKQNVVIQTTRTNEVQLKGIQNQIEDLEKSLLETPEGKTGYDFRKETDKEIKRLQNLARGIENTIIMNKAEITRYATSIAVYNEMINDLLGESNEALS